MNPLKAPRFTGLALVLGVATASGQTVLNGGFETGIDPNPGPGHSTQIDAVNSTSIPGWTVISGSIDYVGTRWQPADGTRSLDMNGGGAGAIQQTLTGFSIGQQYRLSFYLAANPEQPFLYPVTRTLQASIGSMTQSFSTTVGTHTATNMGWTLQTMNFTANAASMTLTFTSLTPSPAGPTLDNVSVSPIPEPNGAMLMVPFVLPMIFLVRRQCPKDFAVGIP